MKNLIKIIGLAMFMLLLSCSTAPQPLVTAPLALERVEIEEVFVEGGSFRMGDAWGGENPDGTPVHTVKVSGFHIAKYEITQKLFRFVMGQDPSDITEDKLPVSSVLWLDAILFCNRLSQANGFEEVYTVSDTKVTADLTKNGYRLPTEAEWEYAARSRGRDDRKWSGTNNEKDLQNYAWYYWENPTPYAVGTKKPNDLGIYDMTGNVEEWCWDWYGPYTSGSKTDPTGPASGTYRVGRGGAWDWDADYSRTVRRDGFTPDKSNPVMGFRVARNG